MQSYVYTISAVRSRLQRGAASVLLFWPYTGELVECSRDNIKHVAALFKAATE